MRELWRRIGWLFRRRRFESDLDEELSHHLALKALEQGSAEAAQRQFGNIMLIKEESRAMWTFTLWEQLVKDIRYGFRAMARSKLFTAMAVLSLALGIGANTAIYSLVDAVMLRALPVRNPGELAILNWREHAGPSLDRHHTGISYDEPGGGRTSPNFPWPAYELLRAHNESFSTLFAYQSAGQLNLIARGQAGVGEIEFVSGNFFTGLGVVPAMGRLLVEDDNRPGASQVAVLSFDFWRTRFASDPAAIGQTLRIKDVPFTIAGVAAPEFFGVKSSAAPVAFVPIATRPSLARNYGDEHDTMFIDPGFYWVEIMGRLRPGVTLARAQAELGARFHQFALSAAANEKQRANLPALWIEEGGSGVDSLRRQFSKPLFVLMTMVALILAIACANIANLLLARAAARRREMAVRLSLGASRMRVVRQLLTESLLLATPGAVLGLGVAALGIRFLVWLVVGDRENFFLRAQLDWRVLGFTLAIALITGIVFGLAPAIEATRVDVTPALKETRASATRSRRGRLGLSRILVIAQIAISLLLVAGAGLFVRTLVNLHSVELGFNRENVLVFSMDASQAGYKGAAWRAFYADMERRVRSLPGVIDASLSDTILVSGANHGIDIHLPGAPAAADQASSTSYLQVSPSFFETMQIPIVLGRSIDTHDVDGAPLAAVVNEVFAKKYFAGQNPIGRHFVFGGGKHAKDMTIAGVARNARYSSLKRDIPPVAYIPYMQDNLSRPPIPIVFELRTAGNPLALAETIRKLVHETAPNIPVTGISTQSRKIDSTIDQERTFANLCSAFAALALLIACVGLYGSMAYAVSRRTNEIGIRMALGAQRRRIVWMVLREVLLVALAGVAIGLAGVWSATSAIKSFLFGMKPADPIALAGSVILLASAAIIAGYAPAWRASRIDPMSALRHE